MSEEQIQEIIDRMEEKRLDVIDHPEKADQYLMEAGIADSQGNIQEPYI
jgi:hypothetical protein